MASLIQELSGKAAMVIIDTPPAIPVADAFVIAGLSDAVILVARRGKTNRDELAELKKRFEQLGARVLGAVLTDAEPRRKGKYSYYAAGAPPAKG
jgi:receptor protein-tyrosine kinase